MAQIERQKEPQKETVNPNLLDFCAADGQKSYRNRSVKGQQEVSCWTHTLASFIMWTYSGVNLSGSKSCCCLCPIPAALSEIKGRL